jgi:hypothetical protein
MDMAHKSVRTSQHMHRALHPDLAAALAEVNGLNAKIAVFVTNMVGTMWCAYIFTAIALLGLPAALQPGGEGLVAWIAQQFLQLVLLSVIMVGQNVQTLAADARAENTFRDTELILDRLDSHTQGGIKDILDRLEELERRLARTAS